MGFIMEKVILSNGFRILLEPVDWARSATMGVWIGSGSRYETPQTAGVSHFIEHMLFKGTARRSALAIAEQMDEIGGALNAYTTKEYTCFYARALDRHVATAFDILCDMITQPALAEKDMQTERGVILEELHMYEDSPEDICADNLYAGVWQDDMLGSNILGERKTIQALTQAELKAHMRQYYTPERMVAVVCGRFDADEIVRLCEENFGALQNMGNPVSAPPAPYRTCIALRKKDFEQTQLALAMPGIGAQDDRRFAMRLLMSILGTSSSSRLYQRIREELGLVYEIEAFSASYLNAGILGVDMALSARNEKKALREVFRIVNGFAGSLTPRELARAKEQYLSGVVMNLESTQSRASQMGRGELLYNEVKSADEIMERVRAVTLDEVRALAGEFLRFDQLSISAAGRVKKEKFYEEMRLAAQGERV